LLATEQFIISACRQAMIKPLILRVAGIYGPERGYWLRQFIERRARLEGKGERWINMIHRDDLVGIILTALKRDVSAEVLNAVDDEPVRQKELFEWLGKTLGRRASSAASEPDQTAAPPLGKRGATNKRISNQKLKQELGYGFLYPTFREGFSAEVSRLGHESK
jgi:nucleoside-diphosphate-sugar epimerase